MKRIEFHFSGSLFWCEIGFKFSGKNSNLSAGNDTMFYMYVCRKTIMINIQFYVHYIFESLEKR